MNNDNNLKYFFKKNGFSIALCSLIAIVLVATLYFSYNSFEKDKNIIGKSDDNSLIEAVDKSDVKSYKETETTTVETTTNNKSSELDTKTEQGTNTTEQCTETTTTDKKVSEKDEEQSSENDTKNQTSLNDDTKIFSLFDESQEMTWPVSGQIVMDYSMETAIYDKTLDQYKTNDSIAISAPEGTDVLASAEGIVESIFEHSEYGNSVVINHGNGWLSTYSQLDKDIAVTVGQVVDEGQIIGQIASPSNYSVLLGPHLNFKITKDDVVTDPKLVLAQLEE